MSDNTKIPHIKSVETRHLEERDSLFRGLQNLDRRSFLKVSTGAAAAALAAGASNHFHSFLPVNVAYAAEGPAGQGFSFAYISDSHLYAKKTNERFVRQLLRAVDDVNKLDPQPDFVFYGGDLAHIEIKMSHDRQESDTSTISSNSSSVSYLSIPVTFKDGMFYTTRSKSNYALKLLMTTTSV